MMKKYWPAIFFFMLSIGLQAQNPLGCDGERYTTVNLFRDIQSTTVQYAQNVDNLGNLVTLEMDVYEPVDNTAAARPVVILAHGGAFVFGERQDMAELCQIIASHGYVAATMSYRLYNLLGGLPDSTDLADAAMKGISDMRAAVRYFKAGVASDTDPWRVDTNSIFIGGISAGAIAALHVAYVDADDEFPAFLEPIVVANGGWRGDTGDSLNMAQSSQVAGVFNGSGALFDADWIEAGEPPIYSYHGDNDETVPYGRDIIVLSGLEVFTVEGSSVLHERAQAVGVEEVFQPVPGGGHTDIYDPFGTYADSVSSLLERLPNMWTEILCGPIVSNEEIVTNHSVVYPNPVRDVLYIDTELTVEDINIFSMHGEIMRVDRTANTSISVEGLAPGMYILSIGYTNDTKEIHRISVIGD